MGHNPWRIWHVSTDEAIVDCTELHISLFWQDKTIENVRCVDPVSCPAIKAKNSNAHHREIHSYYCTHVVTFIRFDSIVNCFASEQI